MVTSANEINIKNIMKPFTKDENEYVVPPWWLIVLLASTPAVLVAILLSIYAWQFPMGLSHEQDIWGQFGDFVGGVLNPVVAWMTLVAVAVSLRFTVHALRETATATRISLRQYENELIQQSNRRIEERDTQLKQSTFQMHQVWIAPGMQEIRREALTFLRSTIESRDITTETTGRAYMGIYRKGRTETGQNRYYMLRGVWEFMADINTLITSNMLDGHLAFQLFGASIEPWVVLNDRVDLREDSNDESQESLDENLWFRERVYPLGTLLRQWQADMNPTLRRQFRK